VIQDCCTLVPGQGRQQRPRSDCKLQRRNRQALESECCCSHGAPAAGGGDALESAALDQRRAPWPVGSCSLCIVLGSGREREKLEDGSVGSYQRKRKDEGGTAHTRTRDERLVMKWLGQTRLHSAHGPSTVGRRSIE
jgi:hypothetical protein